MSDYDFKDLCMDLQRKLPANLHITKEGKNYVWIATKNYDIGTYPMHYEIRLQGRKVYTEIHYESEAIISLNSNDCKTEFLNYFSGKTNFELVQNSTAFYYWYRIKDRGVRFEEDCVDKVLDNLKELIQKTRDDLVDLMDKYF